MLGRSLALGAVAGVGAGGGVSLLLFAWWAGPWALGIGLAGGLTLGLLLGLLNGLVLCALTCRFFFPPADPVHYRRVVGAASVLVSLGATWALFRLCRTPALSFYGLIVEYALPFVGVAAWWASGRGASWCCDQHPERVEKGRHDDTPD